MFLLQRKAKGQELLDKVCEYINLLEKDYFGLNFKDRHGYTVWLENDKRISKQLKSELLFLLSLSLSLSLSFTGSHVGECSNLVVEDEK